MLFAVFIGLSALQVQTPPEAYPGQRGHAEPPAGWFCSPVAKVKAHQCHCKRMASPTNDDPVCEESGPIQESPQCTVWCHVDHCLCGYTCDVAMY